MKNNNLKNRKGIESLEGIESRSVGFLVTVEPNRKPPIPAVKKIKRKKAPSDSHFKGDTIGLEKQPSKDGRIHQKGPSILLPKEVSKPSQEVNKHKP